MKLGAWPALLSAVALATSVATGSASSPVPGPAPPARAEEKARAGSIPVPEVAGQADEVARLLREFDALLASSPAAEAAERRLPEIAARIDAQTGETSQALDAGAAGATLEALTAQWQATRAELIGSVSALTRRATATEEAIARLTSLRTTWTSTRADAWASRAPSQVIGRIDSVLASIAAYQAQLHERRGAVLVLQDKVAQQVAQSELMLGRIAAVQQEAASRLLQRDSVPLWRAEERRRLVTDLPDRVRDAVAADLAQLHQFARDQRWKIRLQGALLVVLVVLVGAARRTARAWTSQGVAPATAVVFEHPVSAAFLLTVLSSVWLYTPPLPRSAVAVLEILALVPALTIMRLLVDRRLVPALYLLGLFFLADIIRHLGAVVPTLEQQLFILEMLAAALVASWWAWGWRRTRDASGSARGAAGAAAMGLVFTVALIAGISGYMRLAVLLGAGMLGSGYLAMVLYASVRVGDGLVDLVLRVRPLRHLSMVRRQRPLIERRVHGLLRWVALGAWVVLALRYFGLWNTAVNATHSALSATLKRGSVSVSLGDVLVFAVTVGAAFGLSALIRFFLSEEVYPRRLVGRGLPDALSGVLHYALLLLGFLLALAVLGADLTKITILAGALGVGIGFGLQSVVNNFVSGAIVLFERKINVGDAIQIGDVSGQVQQVGMRACTVRTGEGAEVIVPNAMLTSERVVNWTLSDRVRRIDVAVGVAHGTRPEKVLEILLGVARAHPRVLADPAPVALLRRFGESALQFELRAWTDHFDIWGQTQSELFMAVYAALLEAGVEIPIPQYEIRLRAGSPAAAGDGCS